MKPTDFLSLLGGLALFLYGMKMMSDGLEQAAGNRLKGILEKLTSNRFVGVLVGAGITALIQSSSATTVMVVGFVNSKLMTLSQAVWVIMGANIGTTITGQLIALDISAVAPLIAFVGVVLVSFVKQKRANCVGLIIAGLGILFVGMELMSTSMSPLRESEAFVGMMTTFQNPLIGIAAGALFTAVIQSSSASVGILQALAMSGVIGLHSAAFVLFGQNIGTCITAVIASIGTSRNAKRTTIIHLLFNLIGTSVFVCICLFSPFTDWVSSWTPDNPAAQIANVHTIFNIVTTLLLLPFGQYLAKLATHILPVKSNETNGEMSLKFVGEHSVGSTAIAISQLRQEVSRMYSIAKENVHLSFYAVVNRTDTDWETINQNEEYLDYLNKEITRYTARAGVNMQYPDSEVTNTLFKITGDIERIGDHAMNLVEYARMIREKRLELSAEMVEELVQMRDNIFDAMDKLLTGDMIGSEDSLIFVAQQEQSIDDFSELYRNNQIKRLETGECPPETCVIYSEMLTDIERVSDHIMNIAEACYKVKQSLTKQDQPVSC